MWRFIKLILKSISIQRGTDEETVDFSTVYELHWQAMFMYAMAILKDKDDAEDIVQEVFTNLLANREGIQVKSSLQNYLYTCVLNQALLKIRKTVREDAYAEELARQAIEGVDTTTEEQRIKELNAILTSLVENLSPRAKEIFRKNRMEGKSHKKIAYELEISEDSSRTTLYRTIKNLKIQLKPFLSILLLIIFR